MIQQAKHLVITTNTMNNISVKFHDSSYTFEAMQFFTKSKKITLQLLNESANETPRAQLQRSMQ